MSLAFQCSILNRNDEAAKEIEQYTEYLLLVIKLIEPESQLKIIQALIPYIKFSLDLSGKFSDLLIENKNFEETKALLEESIFSLNTNTDNQVLAQWYYRTGRAYEGTGKYYMSTKCYEHAFVLLPTHPTAAYHLWSSYRIQGEFDKANDLIQYVPIEYIKHILEMLTNPYEISYEKLGLIKKIPYCLSIHEYMAFYNKISNKQKITKKQQSILTEKLKAISDDHILIAYSLALCSKQFKTASDLLNKMPEHQINLFGNAIIKLQSYIDPNYTLPQNNTLTSNEKVEVLKAVNTTLIV